MNAPTTTALEQPVEQMLNRGKKTLERVLRQAGPAKVGSLQTTPNEVAYVIQLARLAIEGLGISADPHEVKLMKARLRGLDRMAELRKAAEPVLETGQVCELLGVSRETIRKKIERKHLLALPKGGDRVFPAFQFKEGDVLPGIAEVLAALNTDSPFVALSFLLSRNAEFEGRSAIEHLQAGHVDNVLAEARNFLTHGG